MPGTGQGQGVRRPAGDLGKVYLSRAFNDAGSGLVVIDGAETELPELARAPGSDRSAVGNRLGVCSTHVAVHDTAVMMTPVAGALTTNAFDGREPSHIVMIVVIVDVNIIIIMIIIVVVVLDRVTVVVTVVVSG